MVNTNIEKPQIADPNLSQKRFPNQSTNTSMKDNADSTFTTPKSPVRKRLLETVVNPADIKIVGASLNN